MKEFEYEGKKYLTCEKWVPNGECDGDCPEDMRDENGYLDVCVKEKPDPGFVIRDDGKTVSTVGLSDAKHEDFNVTSISKDGKILVWLDHGWHETTLHGNSTSTFVSRDDIEKIECLLDAILIAAEDNIVSGEVGMNVEDMISKIRRLVNGC